MQQESGRRHDASLDHRLRLSCACIIIITHWPHLHIQLKVKIPMITLITLLALITSFQLLSLAQQTILSLGVQADQHKLSAWLTQLDGTTTNYTT